MVMLTRLYVTDDPTQIDATHNSKINSLGIPYLSWKPLMDIDYIMRIQKQVPNQFTFFVTA